MLRLLLVLVLVLATVPARATERDAARALLDLLGFDAFLDAAETRKETVPRAVRGAHPQIAKHWQDAARQHLDYLAIFDLAAREVSASMTDAEIAELLAVYGSPFARRVTALEDQTHLANQDAEATARGRALFAQIVRTDPDRMRILQRFLDASGIVEASLERRMNSHFALFSAMMAADPLSAVLSDAEIWDRIEARAPRLRFEIIENSYVFAAIAYEPLSNEELVRFVEILERDTTRKLYTVIRWAFSTENAHQMRAMGHRIMVLSGRRDL